MASIKNITRKLVNAGFSEDKLMMMTEKQIREAYKSYKAVKEEVAMNNNNTGVNNTAKEEIIMNNNATVETNNNATVVKEEIAMTRTIEELIYDALNVKSFRDKRYVSNKILIAEYKKLTGETIRGRRAIIIAKLQECIQEEQEAVVAGDFCKDNAPVEIKEEPEMVVAGDFCRDNVPESIEEPPVFALDSNIAAKILEKVIRQADTNKAHNFISNWMLTSAISEVLFGTPLKEKKNGKVIEHWKGFSKEQNAALAFIHREFINKSGFVAKRKDGTIVGYTIPAKVLVWGRHKYLNKVCVYKVIDKYGKPLAEYLVSVNGIKNIATGKTMSLTENDYNTLDAKCVFVR